MKRDMDLCRTILLALEGSNSATHREAPEIEGVDPERVSYHVKLLHDAGLIDAIDASTLSGFNWIPQRLTWDGHEFLDAARDDTRWQRAKDVVRKSSGSLTFEGLKIALAETIKAAIQIAT